VSFLSAAYDWMKLRPHGARVVPTVAVMMRIASLVKGMLGVSSPDTAAPQSGPATKPASTYARKIEASTMRTCSIRWN
jgi:hypothetical protein